MIRLRFSSSLSRRSRLTAAIAVVVLASVFTLIAHSSTASSTMSSNFQIIEVPDRIAGLAFTYMRPLDFRALDLPTEKPDFEKPTAFIPLALSMANYGAVIHSVLARPAYGDGTVEDWARYLASENNLRIVSLQPTTIGGLPAILIESLQDAEVGTMRMRTALLEDGTRMINISVMAPDAIWASVEATLQTMLTSFRLTESRGTTTVLTRAAAQEAAAAEAAATARTEPAQSAPAASATPVSQPTAAAQLALADDAATLDPEHPFNVRLRNNGAGFTPRIVETNADEKFAVVGAGAVMAAFRVPFGWHAIDDGQRVLVFDAAGKIQVSLNLRRDDGDVRAMLDRIQAQAQSEQPTIDPLRVDFADDLPGLVLRNYRDGDDVLVQAYVVRQLRNDGLAHVARVTAAADDMTQAMNLAEVILRSLSMEAVLAAR